MSVDHVDWDDLKLFLTDHARVTPSVEQDKFGVRYLVLTAVDEEEVEEEVEEVLEKKTPVEAEKGVMTEEVTTTTAVPDTTTEEEVDDEEEEEEEEVEEEVLEEEEKPAVFRIVIKDTMHEEVVDFTRTIFTSAFIAAVTSTMLSYCAC
jgi:hypothetical protein